MSANPLADGLRRVRSLLESRTTSFWVIGAWVAMTLVWVVPFQITGQSSETIRAIAEDWLAFRVIYVLVGITTLMCTWKRMTRDLRRAQPSEATHPSPTADAALLDRCRLDDVEAWLTEHKYVVSRSEDSISAVKHRYSLLGGSTFHFGLVLCGLSLVAHLLTVDSAILRVTEGQSVDDAATAAGVSAVPSAFRYLTLESIKPEYYEDVLLFTKLESDLSAADGSTRRLSLSEPFWAGPTALVSISDYGLAPHIAIVSADGTQTEHVVAMNLVPPGVEDTVEIPDVPLEISLIAFPDHGVVDGRDVSLSYNIVDPAFLIAVKQAGRTGSLVARELVRLDEPVAAEGYTVRVSGLSRYGSFRMTTAPALPFMGLSFLTMALGLVWRYAFRRHSVLAWKTGDGVLIDGWLDMGGRVAGRERILHRLDRAGVAQ